MNKFITVLTFLLLLHFAAQATIRYVKPTATGSGNGSSWTNASGDLQVMINASAVGDQVWVMSGVYKPYQIFPGLETNPRNKVFYLNRNIQLYGGFAGNEVAISQRVGGNITMLNGDIGTVGDNSDNCYHVMITADLTTATIIDGFTFSNGNANPSSNIFHMNWSAYNFYLAYGAGLYNNYSSPTISNCSFTDNYGHIGGSMMNWYSSPNISNCNFSNNSGRSGCGMYNYYSSAITSNCTFSGNSATSYGGGIMNDHSTSIISNSTFSGNSAPNGSGLYNYFSSLPIVSYCNFSGNSATGFGGGMMNDNSTPQITNATFSGNSAQSGAGAFSTNSSPYFSDCTFSGNSVSNGGGGGGICNRLSAPTVVNCTFSGNLAPGSAGAGIANTSCNSSSIISNCSFTNNSGGSGSGIFNDSSSIIITRCTFSGNSATNSGGGLYNKTSETNINTCSFWNNAASNYGGGMYNYDNSSIISNCSFWSNSATNYGGGVFNYNSSSSFGNCTFTGNSAAVGCGMFNENTATIYPTIKNCILWGNGNSNFHDNNYVSTVTYSDIQGSSIVNGTGNINSDPLFVNAANPNGPDGILRTPDDGLVLYEGSPAYHTGTATGAPPIDILGAMRNNPPSMGAYENVHFKKIYVNLAATGSNNGSSWANAFTNLQTALNSLTDSIWIAAGTYIPTHTLSMRNNLAIIGGFTGTETQLSQRNFAANPTIISGANTRQVFKNADLNSTAVLDGCIISNGNATISGAGMNNSYASPTIRNCVFKDNVCNSTQNEGGGGMFNYYSNPDITNCVFANNTVNNGLAGAGMSNDNANPVINNCIFSGNVVNDYGLGGGMFNFYSNPVISNSVFTGNSVPVNEGGGIYNWSSNPVITNSIIYGNAALASPNINSGATINYSNIEGGHAGTGNINADPLFVNASSPAGADGKWVTADDGLALQPCSPAINSGNLVTPAIPVDIIGNNRVGAYDMGPYEYQGNVSGLASVLGTQSATSTKTQSGTTVYSVCDNSHIIATVLSNGTNPIAGTTAAKVWVATNQPAQFVKRHYEITPATNATNATGSVTLYFTQAEFDDFNAVNAIKLPTNPNDATGKANLLVEKKGGVSSDGSGSPSTYAGITTTINPNDAAIVWNGGNSRWEVTFDITGFSGFWVKTQSAALPVTLINFSGTTNGNTNILKWQVAKEINLSKYELECSKDGVTFVAIGGTMAVNNSNYQFVDEHPFWNNTGKIFYRLKLVDLDGTFTYSPIIVLNTQNTPYDITVYPNPTNDIISISHATIGDKIILFDAMGKQLQVIKVSNSSFTIDLSKYSPGIYFIKSNNGLTTKIIKI